MLALGGDGSLLIAILTAHPKMKGILLDLPEVAVKAKQKISEAGLRLSGRGKIVAGDAFDSVPSGADAYILSRVINSFDDKRAIAILQSCHRAIQDEGKLLLLERVVPDRVEHSLAAQGPAMSELNLMVIGGGRERTAMEHTALLGAAGFTLMKIFPTQSEVSVIEAEAV